MTTHGLCAFPRQVTVTAHDNEKDSTRNEIFLSPSTNNSPPPKLPLSPPVQNLVEKRVNAEGQRIGARCNPHPEMHPTSRTSSRGQSKRTLSEGPIRNSVSARAHKQPGHLIRQYFKLCPIDDASPLFGKELLCTIRSNSYDGRKSFDLLDVVRAVIIDIVADGRVVASFG